MTIENAIELSDKIISFVDSGADNNDLLKSIMKDIREYLVVDINGRKDINIDNCQILITNTPIKLTYNRFREMEGEGRLYAGLVYKGVGFELAPVYK